jgi:nitronate monooxygenase
VFMTRIVRELAPVATGVPAFPLPGYALLPLTTKAQSHGSSDFSGLYAGQAAALAQELPAGELLRNLPRARSSTSAALSPRRSN